MHIYATHGEVSEDGLLAVHGGPKHEIFCMILTFYTYRVPQKKGILDFGLYGSFKTYFHSTIAVNCPILYMGILICLRNPF